MLTTAGEVSLAADCSAHPASMRAIAEAMAIMGLCMCVFPRSLSIYDVYIKYNIFLDEGMKTGGNDVIVCTLTSVQFPSVSVKEGAVNHLMFSKRKHRSDTNGV